MAAAETLISAQNAVILKTLDLKVVMSAQEMMLDNGKLGMNALGLIANLALIVGMMAAVTMIVQGEARLRIATKQN